MNVDQINKRLSEVMERKNKLIEEIQYEIKYLNEHNIDVQIDMNNLRVDEGSKGAVSKSKYLELRDKLAEIDFLDTISNLIKNPPKSNGSSYFKKIDVNIGIIADEFLYNSFKDVANFHYVRRDNYKELEGEIDVLLIASTWKGIEGDWKGMGNPKIRKIRESVFNTINFFRKDGAKIVFYSKEDPTNYDFFVDIAKECDFIFTTAAEKVDDYKKDCNNDNVFVLEFGVNPIYNNPIGIKSKSELEGALFAGSWYKKYPHRQKDTRVLFDGVLSAEKNLKIIDRNYHLNLDRHFYPTEYLKYVSPSVDHETLQGLIKLFSWVINLNSVKYSQTMFANRVYELQAMGNLILSNYSLGINNLFPNIFLAFESSEVQQLMTSLTPKELYQHKLLGVRQVFRKHTTFHRINYLLNQIGITKEYLIDKNVAVIVQEKNDYTLSLFEHQSYKNKSLLTSEEALETTEQFDYVAFFDSSSYYGEYYLEDMINAFKYTEVDFVTKESYFDHNEKIPGVENNFTDKMSSKYRSIISLEVNSLEEVLTNMDNVNLQNGYSSDSLEYNTAREEAFKTNKNKKFTVIIPTYNNGLHLYSKCFMSLRRSSMFKDMEIIIVDDGSTDGETNLIINRLKNSYDNIKVFMFKDGGSGSASRPRNKGTELATTEYITFLDPDNEAVNDGYTKLYETITNEGYDLVIGNMKKVDTQESEFNYYRDIFYYEATTEFTNIDQRRFLDNTHFKAQSIQALMVKKEIITENKLEMVLGAVGQDTLFFHELLVNAQKFKVIDEIIHIYYAGVQGSAVNNITVRTFEKYLKMEKARIKFLRDNNLLETYVGKRFNYYFKNWYLRKLALVTHNEYDSASKLLYEIYSLYDGTISKRDLDPDIKSFMKKVKTR